MYKITMLDRTVLRAISKGNNDLPGLMRDTEIDLAILRNVLQDLIIKNIITFTDNKYTLSSYLCSEQIADINNRTYLDGEKRQMAGALIDSEKMQLEKFYLGPADRMIFEGMLNNIQQFVQNSKSNQGSTKDEIVFLWGKERCGEILTSVMS